MTRFGAPAASSSESDSASESPPLHLPKRSALSHLVAFPSSPYSHPRSVRPAPKRKPLVSASSSAVPFSPAPVRVVKPPKIKTRRGRLVPLSSGSSDSGSELDSSAEENDDDSEEEAWPVGPIGSVGLRGWRRAGGKGKGKAGNEMESGRLYGGPDPLDLWDEKERATSWANANKSFQLSLSRSISDPAVERRSPTSSDVTSIQSLLSTLAIAQSASQASLVASFESRNAALWASIESTILQAEKEEGEKQRMMEENRKRGEEAERKAKQMREDEVKKAEVEKKKIEEGKKEAARKAEERRKVEEAERSKAAAGEATAARAGVQIADAVEGSPKAEWERWTAQMLHIKQAVLPVVSQNPVYRKACFGAKRSITPKIGQLTASLSATGAIINQLHTLLESLRPPAGQESATEPYVWTLNHLAKAVVKQAEQEVTAKLGTAYPLGRVVIGLLARGHTQLGDVLMSRLVKKCFWITGYWPPKQAGMSDADHQKLLGHAPPSASESLVQYAVRQSGLIALYASILQTSPLLAPQGPCPLPSLSNVPPHFRPAAAWRWLNLILRPPLVGLEPTPLLLVTFLEVAGEGMMAVFGRQMAKLLEVLLREGLREGKAGFSDKSRSSLVRLQLWLEDWEKSGLVEKTKGRSGDP